MKKILVTGGMSGLGKEISFLAVSRGYAVDILDISEGELGDSKLPKNIKYIHSDISKIDQDTIKKLAESYETVICNAGISLSGNFLEHDLQANSKLMQINTLGHIELIRLLLKNNKISEGGHIGCIASASEMLPFPIALGYAASKGALRAFADSLRSYLTGRKISVSTVFPGPMPTAHVKYYGKEVSHDKKSEKKVQKIAKNIFNGITKGRTNIYPDFVSKTLAWFPLPRFVLDRIMYKAYKKDIS
ncbi:SDR family oxidoreductase [Candidatus Gracilibacteria bacterium]|nr:SDR family oxidoreductase [Candidatus Gracilibacteria bacterium]